jgi:anti-sigma factor RsiW
MAMTALSKLPDMHPEEVEALLPWHAAGTLSARDARRVDEALARDPKLAKQYAVIQEEFAETIHLNESLGAPSSRAMQRLFAGIDAEPARAPSVSSSFSVRIAGFFASLSPRTLAFSAGAAAIALLLQAGVIGAVLVRQNQTSFQSAAHNAQSDNGVRALVRFAPEARVSDITQFLDAYNASILAGLKGGMFRVQFEKRMTKDEIAGLMKKVEQEKIVSFVAPAQ